MNEVQPQTIRKTQTLAQIAVELPDGRDFNITRLTLLKSLRGAADNAAAFALCIAKKTQQAMKAPKGSGRPPSCDTSWRQTARYRTFSALEVLF